MKLRDGRDLTSIRTVRFISAIRLESTIRVLALLLACRLEVKSMCKISNSCMSQLKQIGDDLPSTFAISFLNESNDAIGTGQVVGVPPVDLIEGGAGAIVGGVVTQDMLLDEDDECCS